MTHRLLALALLAVVGCGPATTITGKVTFEGAPVEAGYVTFFPESKQGATTAAPIKAGVYELTTVKPGPHLAEVTASKKINFALSTAEMEAKAKEALAKGNATGIVESADLIPSGAVGNRKKVVVEPGPQVIDFHLKKP